MKQAFYQKDNGRSRKLFSRHGFCSVHDWFIVLNYLKNTQYSVGNYHHDKIIYICDESEKDCSGRLTKLLEFANLIHISYTKMWSMWPFVGFVIFYNILFSIALKALYWPLIIINIITHILNLLLKKLWQIAVSWSWPSVEG